MHFGIWILENTWLSLFLKCSYKLEDPRTAQGKERLNLAGTFPAHLGTGSILKHRARGDRKKTPGLLLTRGYRGHYLSRTVREELPWKSSILLKGEKVYDASIQQLFQAKIFAKKWECPQENIPGCTLSNGVVKSALWFSGWPMQGTEGRPSLSPEITGWINLQQSNIQENELCLAGKTKYDHTIYCTPPKSGGLSKR